MFEILLPYFNSFGKGKLQAWGNSSSTCKKATSKKIVVIFSVSTILILPTKVFKSNSRWPNIIVKMHDCINEHKPIIKNRLHGLEAFGTWVYALDR